MARPKQDPNTESALERIENAFWEMLAEGPYTDMTIAKLAKRAGVNHNTIYYHFDNIDDMAIRLFEKNITHEIPETLLSSPSENLDNLDFLFTSIDFLKRSKNIRLFARSNSSFLTNHLKQTVFQVWLDVAGITENDLSIENKLELEFIFNGLISIMGSPAIDENPDLIPAMLHRKFFQNVIDTLSQLSAHKNQM